MPEFQVTFGMNMDGAKVAILTFFLIECAPLSSMTVHE